MNTGGQGGQPTFMPLGTTLLPIPDQPLIGMASTTNYKGGIVVLGMNRTMSLLQIKLDKSDKKSAHSVRYKDITLFPNSTKSAICPTKGARRVVTIVDDVIRIYNIRILMVSGCRSVLYKHGHMKCMYCIFDLCGVFSV